MRLRGIGDDGRLGSRLSSLVGSVSGRRMADLDRVLDHRPELFGGAFRPWLHELLRGESGWTVGERELIASYTALQQKCRYCTQFHGAAAALELGEELVHQVWEDLDAAAVSDRLRAALRLVAKMTTNPDQLVVSDLEELRATGLERRQIEEVIQIGAALNILARVADTLAFDVPPWKQLLKLAKTGQKRGYV